MSNYDVEMRLNIKDTDARWGQSLIRYLSPESAGKVSDGADAHTLQ